MKVCKTDVNKISLHSIILQLQLTLELSQFKEILSVYSDLLVLVANYSFIFENSSSEIQALKENPVSVETALITQDPVRDGANWYAYCNGDAVNFVDLWGLESWTRDTLTKDIYDNNFDLRRKYSWEQIQQHFSENPKGIVYRYDTISYYLGASSRDFPNMQQPSVDIALLFTGFVGASKTAGEIIVNMLKSAVKSAVSAFTVDAFVQTKTAAQTGNFDFNVEQSINATAGGFVGGFVSGGLSEIPLTHGVTPGSRLILSNMMGGMSGSMTSQLMYNLEHDQFLDTDMDKAFLYGTGGGGMVGTINFFFPSPLPANTMQILKDGLKDELISSATTEFFRENIECVK